MTAVPTKTGGRVCVPVDLGVLVTEARKQKTLPNHMAGRLPVLNWLESLELERGMGWGESVSRKLWGEESSYAWIRLHYKEVKEWLAFHGGILFTSGVSVKTTGMFWNVFSGFATCVYSFAAATLL